MHLVPAKLFGRKMKITQHNIKMVPVNTMCNETIRTPPYHYHQKQFAEQINEQSIYSGICTPSYLLGFDK